MGDWSDYFEDSPEENPAYGTRGKQWLPGMPFGDRREINALEHDDEINKMMLEAWTAEKERSFLGIVPCPQCGWNELYTYNIGGRYFLCECNDCGIFGKGPTLDSAVAATQDAIGEGLDWREQPRPLRLKKIRDDED